MLPDSDQTAMTAAKIMSRGFERKLFNMIDDGQYKEAKALVEIMPSVPNYGSLNAMFWALVTAKVTQEKHLAEIWQWQDHMQEALEEFLHGNGLEVDNFYAFRMRYEYRKRLSQRKSPL